MDVLDAIRDYQSIVVKREKKRLEEVKQLQESDLVEIEENHSDDCYTMTMEVGDIDKEVRKILNMDITEQATVNPKSKLNASEEVVMEITADLKFDIQKVTSTNYHKERVQDERA